MSFNINGLSCVRCKTYLFPEDDVVYCPVCGAPHHRECYNALNHCALESLHGTPEEYSREKELEAIESANEIREEEKVQAATTRCEICGEVYDSSLEHCPKCGAEEFTGFNNFIQFDMLGGVPADYDLGDGITANDAKNFVMANTHRYIQKFALLNKKHKVSWNWVAFLFPFEWMLSRKMYKNAAITGLLIAITTVLRYPLDLKLYNMGFGSTPVTYKVIESMIAQIFQMEKAVVVFAAISMLLNLCIRILSGVFEDYSYKKYVLSTMKQIRSNSEDILADYRRKGGVNVFLFLLGVLLVQYVPLILVSIL